jgi:serine protease Do
VASAVDRFLPASINTENLSDQVAEALRRVTVQIFGPTGNRGAGVIWSSDGLIVTNAHVVNGTSMVRLHDGRTCRAELVRKDRDADLALLRISVVGIESARLRDTQTLRTGEVVVAVGHPMGEAGAVSLGIVHRASPGALIEADIRLVPGNSGGPLADASGHVVGINCMVANGMGVAISTAAIQQFLEGNSAAWERAR